jgi:hypothetical protein
VTQLGTIIGYMRELHTHALHSAKVINLPSHNAKYFKCKCKTKKGEKRFTWSAGGLVLSSPLSVFVQPSSCVHVFSLPSGSSGASACWRWRFGSDYVWIFVPIKIFTVEKMKENFPCSPLFSVLFSPLSFSVFCLFFYFLLPASLPLFFSPH